MHATVADPPVVIKAAAHGSGPNQMMMFGYYETDLATLPAMGIVGESLWRRSGLWPQDVQTAILYDHFTPFVLVQLEELGFCGRGEAKEFISDGGIELGGRFRSIRTGVSWARRTSTG